MIDTAVSDAKHALRRIARAPGVFALAVLSLALAFAPSVAVFGVMDRLFLTPLPIKAPGEVIEILLRDVRPAAKPPYQQLSYPDFQDFRGSLNSVTGLTYERRQGVSIVIDARRLLVWTHLVSDNYFGLLGIPVRYGPGFAGDAYPIVISHSLWVREFHTAPDVVGRQLLVNGRTFTITGIAAPDFRGTERIVSIDLWAPLDTWLRADSRYQAITNRRDYREGRVWARLQRGVALEASQAEIGRAADRIAKTWPATNRYLTGDAYFVLKDRDQGGLVLTSIGALVLGLLLAVACANLAGILLAQAEERRHELAVRQALGASRARLVRQWITESAVLAFAGATLGLIGARLLMNLLPALQPFTIIPLNFEFSLGPRVWLYAVCLMAASALGFGLVPAWRASRPELLSGLRRDATIRVLQIRIPIRSLLIVAQVATAELLLFGAGLALDNLANARRIDPGFDPHRPVVLVTLLPPQEEGVRRDLDSSAVAARLAQLPGVRRASYGCSAPLSGMRGPGIKVELPGSGPGEVAGGSAGPGFLSIVGVRMLSGRDFLPSDRQTVLVNATMARQVDPAGNAVGRMIRVEGQPREVVGVFQDTAWTSLRDAPEPRLIALESPRPTGDSNLAIEVTGEPRSYLEAIRKELAAVEGRSMLVSLKTLRQHYQESLYLERTASQVLYVLGLLALLLTAAGLHGVAAALFARRSKEFGLRLVLGATPGRIMALVFRQSFVLIAAGVGAGLAVAIPAALVLASKKYGFSPWSLSAVGLSSAIVAIAALAAAAHPARRALRLQPTDVLRAE